MSENIIFNIIEVLKQYEFENWEDECSGSANIEYSELDGNNVVEKLESLNIVIKELKKLGILVVENDGEAPFEVHHKHGSSFVFDFSYIPGKLFSKEEQDEINAESDPE